jgi:hypothetical protein
MHAFVVVEEQADAVRAVMALGLDLLVRENDQGCRLR